MKMFSIIMVFTLFSFGAFAKGIRTIKVNASIMAPIKLQMGKATVLRFQNPPKKIVVGNQNYFSVEFIENDLTIQPLNNVETNLFVYTKYRTYGFALSACYNCGHDDLVFVKWQSPSVKRSIKRNSRLPKVSKVNLNKAIHIEKVASALITGVETNLNGKLMFFDIKVSNLARKPINTKELKIFGTTRGKPIQGQGYVVGTTKLKPNETAKARLFLPKNTKDSLKLHLKVGDKSRFTRIPMSRLRL